MGCYSSMFEVFSMLQLKSLFLGSLYKWILAFDCIKFSSFLGFIDRLIFACVL